MDKDRSVTESIQSELDLDSTALQFVSSDLSKKSFANQNPQWLEDAELGASTTTQDAASFSEKLDSFFDAPAFNFDSAKLVWQSVDTNSNSSDLRLDSSIAQESVFKEAETHMLEPSAPMFGSLVPEPETAFEKIQSSTEQSLNYGQISAVDDKKYETSKSIVSTIPTATDTNLLQPVDTQSENKGGDKILIFIAIVFVGSVLYNFCTCLQYFKMSTLYLLLVKIGSYFFIYKAELVDI